MKKYLLLAVLLLTPLLGYPQGMQPCGGVTVKYGTAGTCSSCGSTSVQGGCAVTEPDNYTSPGETCRAVKFTLAATRCITGISAGTHDDGNSGTLYAEIWTDSSGPGSLVTGCSASLGSASIPNANDPYARQDFTFPSIQTLAAGDYWIVLRPESGYSWRGFMDTTDASCSVSSVQATATEGACGAFGSHLGIDFDVRVVGCTP